MEATSETLWTGVGEKKGAEESAASSAALVSRVGVREGGREENAAGVRKGEEAGASGVGVIKDVEVTAAPSEPKSLDLVSGFIS